MARLSPTPSFLTIISRSYSSLHSQSDSLLHRLLNVGDPKLSVAPLLEQWRSEGKPVKFFHFRKLVSSMKRVYRWHHALQISEWMSDRRCFRLAPKDAADRLELLARVCGIEAAEMYFDGLAEDLRTYHAYGAMLQNYVRRKDVEKAEVMMRKMKELRMVKKRYSFPYNNMIFLYFQTGEYDKIDQLVCDMKSEGVRPNVNTARNLLRVYAVSDITKMEELLDEIKEHQDFEAGWQEYSIMANGYLEAGCGDKALEMLHEVERTIPPSGNRFAAQYLITHFASVGCKGDVYRVWYQNKPSSKQLNMFATCMISALAKLDDIDGAETILREWESECDQYEFSVVNQLVNMYCRKGLVDRAKSLVENKLAERREPCSSTWRILAGAYTSEKRMPEAIEMFKNAMRYCHQEWTQKSLSDMKTCLDYLEEQADFVGLGEMVRLLKESGMMTMDIYHQFLRASIASGKCASWPLQMESDGFVADEETRKIIQMKGTMLTCGKVEATGRISVTV